METITVTQKEYDFLSDIANSDFSLNNDDGGLLDLVCEDTQYDMKVVRGLMGSLKEKNLFVWIGYGNFWFLFIVVFFL